MAHWQLSHWQLSDRTAVRSDSCPIWQLYALTVVWSDSCPILQMSDLTAIIWQLSANQFLCIHLLNSFILVLLKVLQHSLLPSLGNASMTSYKKFLHYNTYTVSTIEVAIGCRVNCWSSAIIYRVVDYMAIRKPWIAKWNKSLKDFFEILKLFLRQDSEDEIWASSV